MYIWVAFGLEGGNQSSGAGWWPKRKCWRCVCVFLASGYEWVTVMHEIPISSAQSMTSYFHTLGLSNTTPLVPLAGAVTHEKAPTSL